MKRKVDLYIVQCVCTCFMVTQFFCLYAHDYAMKYKQNALYKGPISFLKFSSSFVHWVVSKQVNQNNKLK